MVSDYFLADFKMQALATRISQHRDVLTAFPATANLPSARACALHSAGISGVDGVIEVAEPSESVISGNWRFTSASRATSGILKTEQ